MATWHCPVCGLDFAFHSELDWHVREAHCLKRTAGLAGQLERQAVLDWGLLRRLQSAEGGPSVSLLLWTTPAAVMTPSDATDLHQLADVALGRLGGQPRGEARRRMELRLEEALRAAEHSPTDHGLAVFASPNETAVVALPFSPRERAVVNHGFATRDLLDALQTFPMYRALVLRGPGFRLLEGRAERLSEVFDWQVPNPSLRRARESAWTPRQRWQTALAEADRAIGVRVAVLGRLPLVVLGRKHLLAEFRKRSPHSSSLVGEVAAWGSMLSSASAAQLATPLIRSWREQHTQRYLDALAEADKSGAVVWGLEKVWDAVVAGQVERMWVERDYWLPARLADRDKRLLPAESKEVHRIVPDIVDLTIERAALGGAHVEIVARLGEGGGPRIAAQLGHSLGRDEEPLADEFFVQAPVDARSPRGNGQAAQGKQLAHG
jgi:Bacterial archaeo-eukaryotic release factor family 3